MPSNSDLGALAGWPDHIPLADGMWISVDLWSLPNQNLQIRIFSARNSDLAALACQTTYLWLQGGGFPGIYRAWLAKTSESELPVLSNSDLGALAGQTTYLWLPGGGWNCGVWQDKTSKSC